MYEGGNTGRPTSLAGPKSLFKQPSPLGVDICQTAQLNVTAVTANFNEQVVTKRQKLQFSGQLFRDDCRKAPPIFSFPHRNCCLMAREFRACFQIAVM